MCNARRTYTDSQLLYAYEELMYKNTYLWQQLRFEFTKQSNKQMHGSKA
jgi:hypothetical protein